MIQYTFKHGPFFFNIHAEDDKDAVRKVRKALEETSPEVSSPYLQVDLTGGAFDGRVYIEPAEVSVKDICKREVLRDDPGDVPF